MRSLTLTFAMVLLPGCAGHSIPDPDRRTTANGLASTSGLQDSLAIVGAVGRVLVEEQGRRGIVVGALSDVYGQSVDLNDRQRAIVRELSRALAAATAWELIEPPQSTRRAAVNLEAIAVAADSGFVDLLKTPDMPVGAPIVFSSIRYHFRRDGGRWVFVERELLAAA